MHPRLNIPLSQENPLWISWHDTAWIAVLNPTNVMDYFMEKSNPFYDRTCNNEIVKMQRQSFEHLKWVCQQHQKLMLMKNRKKQQQQNYWNKILSFYVFSNMVGVEYILLHVQDPILYVVCEY